MKFSFVILLVPHVWAVWERYEGFDGCSEGWVCDSKQPSVAYDCSLGYTQNARFWTWTARLPHDVVELTIRNCHHVQIHMDCYSNSRMYRGKNLNVLKLINITILDILPPTETGEYLHDNIPVPHVPDTFYLENIASTSFYKGLFKGPTEECGNKVKMKTMFARNVRIKYLEEDVFANEVNQLHWTNVTVEEIHENAMVIKGNVSIINSTFPSLPSHAIRISGHNVHLSGNRIGRIYPSGIAAHSYNFLFSDNSVTEIMSTALMVWGFHVTIQGNHIHILSTSALRGVSPALYSIKGTRIRKLTYDFVENEIDILEPASLHCNWEAYSEICSNFVVQKNVVDCTCKNLYWLTMQMDERSGTFYRAFLNASNFCRESSNCTVTRELVNVCSSSSKPENPCSELFANRNGSEGTGAIRSNGTNETTPPSHNGTGISDAVFFTLSNEARITPDSNLSLDASMEAADEDSIEEIISSANSYNRDELFSEPSQSVIPVWIVVLVIGTLLAIAASAVLVWWMNKRKKSLGVRSLCKYTVNNDADKLIMNLKADVSTNECHNMLFEN